MTAYFGLLRISEVAVTQSSHAIRVTDLHIRQNKKKILFSIKSSKTHGKYSRPQLVKITTKEFVGGFPKKLHNICPYHSIHAYLEQQPRYKYQSEQFFVFRDSSPVKEIHVRSTLHLILHLMGHDESLYNFHSFRAGWCICGNY